MDIPEEVVEEVALGPVWDQMVEQMHHVVDNGMHQQHIVHFIT